MISDFWSGLCNKLLTYSPPYKGRDSSRVAPWNYWFIESTYIKSLAVSNPEMVLSPVFLLHFRSPFPYALRYSSNLNYLVFWYLVLKSFTLRSLPLKNSLNLVFKVRCLSATRFFEWLITLATVLNNTTNTITNQYKAALERRGFKPIFSVKDYSCPFSPNYQPKLSIPN